MKAKVLFILIIILLSAGSVLASSQDIDIDYLQQVLDREGYRPGPIDGVFGEKTRDALIAFQKAHGLPNRDGRLDAETEIALRNIRNLKPKKTGKGVHIEIDINRQLLYLVEGGEIMNVIHVSTGRNEKTPKGSFNIYEKVTDGWVTAIGRDGKPQGQMYKPLKFYGPFYIHGSHSVPSYPASLGCVRVHPRNMSFLHRITSIGTEVLIY